MHKNPLRFQPLKLEHLMIISNFNITILQYKEKYVTFTVPIEKEFIKIDENGEKITKIAVYY